MSECVCVIYQPQALLELESNADIKPTLREVIFSGAKEIDAASKKAICIFVPVPQQKTFQKIQVGGNRLQWQVIANCINCQKKGKKHPAL